MAFKDELRYLRKQENMTQADLALALGIAKSTISMYECGNREPDFETLELIADYFNVDMNRLTGTASSPSFSLSADEIELVRNYRVASTDTRNAVRAVLGLPPLESCAEKIG